MKTIIAGSRDITDYAMVEKAMELAKDEGIHPTQIVCGMARGVDLLGERWAEDNGLPVTRFPANWREYGKAAGPIRNVQMARYAEALVALWDGVSRGTQGMIDLAIEHGLQVFIYAKKPTEFVEF